MGNFKDAFTDIISKAQDAHNTIANQLPNDERLLDVMQKMVRKQFQPPSA